MSRINEEEYMFLKNLDDKWKWIARDDNYGGSIFCFREKPHKDIKGGEWGPDTTQYKWLGKCEILFQFIQWEDGEPYNIQELIDEYLDDEYGYFNMKLSREFEEFIKKETEGAEMEKGIEWLKREMHKELESWYGVEGGIDGDGINEIMLLINQFEESKVKKLERKIKELESYNDELIRDNNQFRNELDNQEVLSQEKVQIPWFVYKWIEHQKMFDFTIYDLLSLASKEKWETESMNKFINENGELFIKAWLAYPNIEVEEEQKYIVSDNSSIPLLIKDDSGKVMSYDSQIAYNNSNGTIELTEQEIKDYDERYMTFAKPVEEIEK